MTKPNEELKAFGKTSLLLPGQKQTISFVIGTKELASFDTNSTSWIAEAGKYTIKIGASSLDIKQTATFNLTKNWWWKNAIKVLVPKVEINELKM